MPNFVQTYRNYIKNTRHCDNHFGFDLRRLAAIEPFLHFLYKDWWRVQSIGLDLLPKQGPALIVGNSNGLIPWPAFMLMYALMSQESPRRLTVVADMDWIEDERVHAFLLQVGFVPWSSTNLKYLFSKGELVAVFPEGLPATGKPFSERYRVREFDWSRLLPAFESGAPIYPVATIGCDEASPTLLNVETLSKLLSLPSFPVTPFFPWFPFPANLGSLPVKWKMTMLKPTPWEDTSGDRDALVDTARQHTRYVEGQIQAEINRMLRARIKTYI
ncbi:MAG: 1-acyl-sn-glycerol-3-phosphate acyltransferase [Cyanobacteria bacterium SZAS LIN-5]|nr:1-acyl-sn-glycerol-3-phosphate acyltransferase [Cyanobacteria bacterium SZAS LIN-5]